MDKQYRQNIGCRANSLGPKYGSTKLALFLNYKKIVCNSNISFCFLLLTKLATKLWGLSVLTSIEQQLLSAQPRLTILIIAYPFNLFNYFANSFLQDYKE